MEWLEAGASQGELHVVAGAIKGPPGHSEVTGHVLGVRAHVGRGYSDGRVCLPLLPVWGQHGRHTAHQVCHLPLAQAKPAEHILLDQHFKFVIYCGIAIAKKKMQLKNSEITAKTLRLILTTDGKCHIVLSDNC